MRKGNPCLSCFALVSNFSLLTIIIVLLIQNIIVVSFNNFVVQKHAIRNDLKYAYSSTLSLSQRTLRIPSPSKIKTFMSSTTPDGVGDTNKIILFKPDSNEEEVRIIQNFNQIQLGGSTKIGNIENLD